MNSSIERYLKEIRTIVPSYEGAKRGRGQCSLLSSLSKEDKKKFMNLENKIRLERNRLCAKRNRDKKRSNLENLIEENENLKSLVEKLLDKNARLEKKIKKLKEKKVITFSRDTKKDKVNKDDYTLKLQDFDDLKFSDMDLEEPFVFDI